jgi:hypothetical protein
MYGKFTAASAGWDNSMVKTKNATRVAILSCIYALMLLFAKDLPS